MSSPYLDLTSDDLESHIIVNVLSTLTNATIWFVHGCIVFHCGRTDVRTYVRTYIRTDGHYYREHYDIMTVNRVRTLISELAYRPWYGRDETHAGCVACCAYGASARITTWAAKTG